MSISRGDFLSSLLAEWARSGTFNGQPSSANARFSIDMSGVASAGTPECPD
jgi:hypothetical protein